MAIPIDCSLPGPEKGVDDLLVTKGPEIFKNHLADRIKNYIANSKLEKHLLYEAIKYLSGDVIRDNFLPAIRKAGLVGEERNAVICYVAACSRCSKDINGALHVTLLGPSAGGKSSIAEKVCEHFITEKYSKERASFTVAALYRGGETALKKKVIVLSEIIHLDQEQEDISAFLRTLKTKGKAERELVIKKGKELVVVTLKVEGPCSFIGTTTSFAGKDEDTNRDVFCTLDDSIEQTKRIREVKNQKLKKYNPGSEKWITENKNIQQVVQDLLVKFIPRFIEIPYIDDINYPDREERARRDGDKIDKALQAICHINMLNRKIKVINSKDMVNEIKEFVEKYDFRTFDLHPVVSIQNPELSSNSNENQTIKDQNNYNFKLQSLFLNGNKALGQTNSPSDESSYEVIVGVEGENVIIDSPDPFLNYGILEEFIYKRKSEFVLISDERDFSILKEYFEASIEAAYNELGQNLMKYYRALIKEGERTDNYEFTASRFAKLVNQSDTWTRKVLNRLADKDFAELINPGKKPLKFKIIKNKLSDSFDTEQNSKEYRLFLKEQSENIGSSCFDLEYCRIKRQFFIKSRDEIKTTMVISEVSNTLAKTTQEIAEHGQLEKVTIDLSQKSGLKDVLHSETTQLGLFKQRIAEKNLLEKVKEVDATQPVQN